MPNQYQHVVTVALTPERAFAMVDDLSTFAKWLPWPFVSHAKVGCARNVPGYTLQYVFAQGGRLTAMYGAILDRILGHKLRCKYTDRSIEVRMDPWVAPAASGAITSHDITISPKALVDTLTWPLTRFAVGKQAQEAAADLKKLLETEAGRKAGSLRLSGEFKLRRDGGSACRSRVVRNCLEQRLPCGNACAAGASVVQAM